MTLFVHRGRSTDVLAHGLAELLADPLEDPFAEEVVAVPTRGVERWLAQRLSHRLGAGDGDDGVCAGVRFLTPHSLVAMVLGVERDDPWHPDQLAWPLLRVVDASLGEPWAATLATHLGHGLTGVERELRNGRRYAVARRLAGLFADYAAQRPTMLADWRAGGAGDGHGGQLDEDLAWQPELWRRVVDQVGGQTPDERAGRVVRLLREQGAGALGPLGGGRQGELVLPGRLSLFGHTRIARSEVEVVAALGEHLDVHLWLPQASPAAWDRLASVAAQGPVAREADDSALLVRHPLLASLGRDSRELQRTLAIAGGQERVVDGAGELGVAGTGAGAGHGGPHSLLHLLQSDLAADHVPDETERAARQVPVTDRSVQVHACHGQSRQVEVLRDVLAQLLEDDPTLEPRDVLVMCPDIDAYAPLVHAGFGLGEVVREEPAHPAHGLRVRLADRAPVQTNPLLGLATRLLELAGGRVTASEVLDLARAAPVRHRFGLDDDDLERLGDWVKSTAVRWGLDAEHRAGYQLPHLTQNTWQVALDRLLVGAAVDGEDTDHLGQTLALDDLDSGDLDLAGRLAELVDRLAHTVRGLRAADTVVEWVRLLKEGVFGLADTAYRDAWQLAQLERELDRLETAATRGGAAAGGGGAAAGGGAGRGGASQSAGRGSAMSLSLSLSDVHALLGEQAAGRATRANFRTGTLTVCTMVPMRSVPHRVVALVGLDDGVFPRSTTPDGDDALARRPVTGERDLRGEDRQLLLDAVMSAGETLVITYTGFDEHSGQERPPAVPLGELLDAVRRTASPEGADRVVTAHPLQPFDVRNLGAVDEGRPALPPGDAPFSFDPAALAGARAAVEERTGPEPVARHRLTPVDTEADVDLGELIRFFDNPARAFLRSRLGLILPEVPEIRGEGIPIELDGLAAWAVGDRILSAVLGGRDPVATFDAEHWRGELPPFELGTRVLDDITRNVQALCEATWRTTGLGGLGQPLPREALDVDLTLPSGRRLVGTVPGMVGQRALEVTYSTVAAKQRLRSWITSLALAAALGQEASSHVIGRYRWGRAKGYVLATHGPHEPQAALDLLEQLVDLRDRGLCEPLPLSPKTSLRWAQAWLSGPGDQAAATMDAEREWKTNDTFDSAFPKEQDDPSVRYVHGDSVPLTAVLGVPDDDERWTPGVDSRLGQLALRVWAPVLRGAERLERV
ncbi:exodeoxyribonuclease V subunit gamma [Ornithinimicrobium pratense]|uniref:RecBCD enzyme subunit RecC n=1 Tax=Ornithinimicrobium pratense TaxID=2593973 RepID=A0A5J6V8A6_9MICO|nr:exodeoxyribonuclease V subunit gamma [Ornithinimicrobium pratense]QFG69807.1 exodeoxyribonuclease V subunit gamma [Ornithinimicrobium pratense]